MKTIATSLAAAAALLPLALAAEPASPASAVVPAPAPAAAEASNPDALKVVQDTLDFYKELDSIAASDKTVEEKAAAFFALQPRATELGKAVQAVGMRALVDAANDMDAEPDCPALEEALETPELAEALLPLFVLMSGEDPASMDDEEGDVPTEANSPEAAAMSEFMMHYLQKPEPDKIAGLIDQQVKLYPSLNRHPALPATLLFFAEVFKANPGRVEGWLSQAAQHPQPWQEFLQAADAYAKGEMGEVTEAEFASPDRLDACWGGFIASGDKKYPEYVLKVASAEEAPNTIDMTIRAAAWSASSFIQTHPEMKAIARAWFATASEEQRLNFARRTNEETQQAVFDKVLLTAAQQDELNGFTDEEEEPVAEEVEGGEAPAPSAPGAVPAP